MMYDITICYLNNLPTIIYYEHYIIKYIISITYSEELITIRRGNLRRPLWFRTCWKYAAKLAANKGNWPQWDSKDLGLPIYGNESLQKKVSSNYIFDEYTVEEREEKNMEF